MRAFEFITSHMVYNLPYTYIILQMTTTQVIHEPQANNSDVEHDSPLQDDFSTKMALSKFYTFLLYESGTNVICPVQIRKLKKFWVSKIFFS